MRSHAVGGGMRRGRWVGGVASILAGLVLAAVPVLGISRLGGEALSSWGAREGSPGEVSFVEGLSSLSPLTFEAPAATVRATQEKAQRILARANPKRERVTDLRDWTFTQSNAQTIKQLQDFLALEQAWFTYGALFVQTALQSGVLSSDQIAFALLQPFIQLPVLGPSPGVGTQLILDFIIASAIPGAEPLVNLIISEFVWNSFLLQQGITLPQLVQVIGYETLLNMLEKQLLIQQLLQQPPPSPSQ